MFAPQAATGNEEHAKRLTTYTKTAILITFSLIVLFYTTKLNKQDDNLFMILASFGSLLLALLCALVLTALICSVKSRDRDSFLCRHEEKMYIFVYGTNFVLMLTAFSFLLLCTFEYVYLAVFLVPALLIIVSLYRQGAERKHTESIKKYGDHDSELNRFSELSAAVVLMLFIGLSTTIFSSPMLSRQNHQIKGTECFLFVIIVMSLVLMLLTSVPPAVIGTSTIARMVGAVKFLSYALVSLLIMVGLMAVSEILQGIVVFSMFAHITGATYWLVSEVSYGHVDQVRSTGAQPEPKKELDSLSMVFATSAFSVLMSVYAKNVDNVEPYSWWNKFLMALCMVSLCSTFISCLAKMVIFNYALETPAWAKGKRVLSIITYISMFVALISTFMLAVYIKLILKLNV